MSYVIKEDQPNLVEIREIDCGDYFEFDRDVYQRMGLSSNFNLKPIHDIEYPIYAINLTSHLITFFSRNSKTLVTPLYEFAPLSLSRNRP